MSADLFTRDDYKAYLNAALDDPARGGGRGSRTRLSNAMGCQTAYTAQVLRGNAHLSSEQAEAANLFLGHDEEEARFFHLLVQYARAGTIPLRKRFEKEIARTREGRLLLKNRLGVKQTLSHEDRVIYYSSWHYAAIHALASIPSLRTASALTNHLQMDPTRIHETLSFLQQAGILEKTAEGYRIGQARIHLGSDSPLISKHHINWRLQAIRALEGAPAENLHYSSAISISEADAKQIRETLVKTLEQLKPVIRDSAEETARCLSIDFFRF